MENWQFALLIISFLIVFPLFFLGIVFLTSRLGWNRIAQTYASLEEDPRGELIRSASARIGLSNYNHVLRIHFHENGMYLRPGFPFSIGHRLLFIPWEKMKIQPKKNYFFQQSILLEPTGTIPIRLIGKRSVMALEKKIEELKLQN